VNKDIWLFGYGSIIWKTGFEFEEAIPSIVHGWARRFWQASTDHRGTPELPGRVVTLAEITDECCTGMAYRLSQARAEHILAALDHREKGGYERVNLSIKPVDGDIVRALTYVALPGNPGFLGKASDDEIANQIVRSTGPSGTNKEYILALNQALIDLNIDDEHIRTLASLVTQKMGTIT
jgi:cation transport protein ChaC